MEENQVREKLGKLIHRASCPLQCSGADEDIPLSARDLAAADAILQSPDLRVTIREKKYNALEAYSICPGEYDCYRPPTREAIVIDPEGRTVGRFHELQRAEDYAAYLNSKGPK